MAAHDTDRRCGDCRSSEDRHVAETLSLAGSGVFVAAGIVGQWFDLLSPVLVRTGAICGIAAGGWFLLPKAWRALLRLRPDINLLMLVAVSGAAVVGEWVEGATVVFLFGVAEWLERWAEGRSKRAVEALLNLTPKKALVKQGREYVEVAVERVRVGDTVAVKSGMAIPVDGMVVAGESNVNQAPITGESLPVPKSVGAAVFAGSINCEGALEIAATKEAGDSTLSRIIRLVAEAQKQKAPSQRFVDSFARYYTPAVTLGALLVFVVPPLLWDGDWMIWLYRACVLLIIACPCALVISTPVSVVAGLTALARRGVLVKGGEHLETLARLRAVAFDKTGTVTVGRPKVEEIVAFGTTVDSVLRVAAALDAHSSHPIAQAIVRHADELGVTFSRALNYQNRSGRGAEGTIDGDDYFVGNRRFAAELGICAPAIEAALNEIECSGRSVVIVGHRRHDLCAGDALGIIAVGDVIRSNAGAAIKELHRVGVEKVVMLSGDNQRTVERIAAGVGIDEARGDLLPDDKVAAVQALRAEYGIVGMVGDGVNDAPAMAAASVGISMGGAGSDAAIETSDIALMRDDLAEVAAAVVVGRQTLRIIKFNITFSLGLKLIFLLLTISGYASLWLAILADTGATLLVVANSLRLVQRSTLARIFPKI